MKKIMIILIAVLFTVNVASKEKAKKKTIQWGEIQGQMNWNAAKEKCESLKMRLPTIEELNAAYAARITIPWMIEAGDYWSSSPALLFGTYAADRAYYFSIGDGYTGDNAKDSEHYVRCVK